MVAKRSGISVALIIWLSLFIFLSILHSDLTWLFWSILLYGASLWAWPKSLGYPRPILSFLNDWALLKLISKLWTQDVALILRLCFRSELSRVELVIRGVVLNSFAKFLVSEIHILLRRKSGSEKTLVLWRRAKSLTIWIQPWISCLYKEFSELPFVHLNIRLSHLLWRYPSKILSPLSVTSKRWNNF